MIYIPKIAIIGAGPAGIAAAVQLKRYDIPTLLFEADAVGGLLRNARLIENYPGFPKGITGPGLVKKLRQHLKRSGIEVVNETVIGLDYSGGELHVQTNLLPTIAQIAIIASGTKPRIPDKPVIAESIRDRVLYRIYPIRNIADKRVIIVGAGDAAFDYALNLARKNEVIILNRGNASRALPILREETSLTSGIKYFKDTPVRDIIESEGERLIVISEREKRTIEMEADYVIFAVGRDPELRFVTDNLKKQMPQLRAAGELYLVGDVKNGIYRQAAIAVGDGVRAAMDIYSALNE